MIPTNITSLDDKRDPRYFNILCLCVACLHRWIGSVKFKTSLFKLECPKCGCQDSFASFIPLDYTELEYE